MLRGTLIYAVLCIVPDMTDCFIDPFRAEHPVPHASAGLSPVGLSPVGVREQSGATDPVAGDVKSESGAQDPFQRKYRHQTGGGTSGLIWICRILGL